jgi:hypothetical protein
MIKLTLEARGSGKTAILLCDQELAIGTGAWFARRLAGLSSAAMIRPNGFRHGVATSCV